jgi:hypothetical protein
LFIPPHYIINKELDQAITGGRNSMKQLSLDFMKEKSELVVTFEKETVRKMTEIMAYAIIEIYKKEREDQNDGNPEKH